MTVQSILQFIELRISVRNLGLKFLLHVTLFDGTEHRVGKNVDPCDYQNKSKRQMFCVTRITCGSSIN